jgi:hypothetical protein
MKKFIFILTFASILFACGDSESGTSKYTDAATCVGTGSLITYNLAVKPILEASCAFTGCHDTKTASDKVILDTYAGAKSSFVDGTSLCAINHDCKKMPQGGDKLDAATLNILACWVKNGAPQ